ncbi:phosphotransferase family protein [Pseudorhodobacter ferrugineus]|uniref:phosphotransferase family protein n=1 Tax=Pseudorhodobacter ferrugineus TaxID=77008 RepID=UPI0003B640FD|nr:aminoglycoside phosphotransferase family protein [Pseudorhodobacter ferrugineus]
MTLQYPNQIPPQTLRIAVDLALPTQGAVWQPLQGGRVNTVWRLGDIIVKQFQPNGDSPLFPNDPAAEAAALQLLAPHGFVPTLLAQGQGWLAYQYCPGSAWQSGTELVAHILTRLHQIPAPTHAFRAGPNGSTQLLEQAKSIAALCPKTLPPAPPDPQVPSGPTCLIHGDLVAGNLIVNKGNITLIDWQCPLIGDPTEDIAAFLSPAMQVLYRGSPLTLDEIAVFRAALPPQTVQRYDQLAALYHWRMAAHCLWKASQNAPDYAPALQLELTALQRLTQKNPG